MFLGEFFRQLGGDGRFYTGEKMIGGETSLVISTCTEGCLVLRLARKNEIGRRVDPQGRLLIPCALRKKAGLGRKIVINGFKNRLEVWDRARWEEEIQEIQEEKKSEVRD